MIFGRKGRVMTIKLIDLIVKGDDRGSLIALEEYHYVPFDVKRVYYIFGTNTVKVLFLSN